MNATVKLTGPEVRALREKAQRTPLTVEEVALFVASTRASFLALPTKAPKALTSKKVEITENQIDFF